VGYTAYVSLMAVSGTKGENQNDINSHVACLSETVCDCVPEPHIEAGYGRK